MRVRIPVQEVKVGDIDPATGKSVVNVLHRFDLMVRQRYVRAVLQGGWPLIDGYYGKIVEVERHTDRR